RSQLFLAYQPIIDVGTHEMVAAEALLRWLNPTRGLLSAGNVLETAGSVPVSVDSWCVSQAIAHAAEWSKRGFDLKVHANVSNPTAELFDRVLEYLESAHLPSNLIALEISEHIVAKGTYDLAAFTARCREAGIDVLLDRFSGALSLAGLRKLDLSAIKLSPEIVAALEHDRNAQSVARAAIN
ncbi:MAG: EAL domain-containing protein, partial [Rhodanobacteraceae bacterium]